MGASLAGSFPSARGREARGTFLPDRRGALAHVLVHEREHLQSDGLMLM